MEPTLLRMAGVRLLLPLEMRVILYIIFLFFIGLIALENAIVSLKHSSKQILKRLFKKISVVAELVRMRIVLGIDLIRKKENRQAVIASFKKLRLHMKKRKRKKQIIPTPAFFIKTKIKYFLFGTAFSFVFVFLPLVGLIFLQELPSPRELSLRQEPQTTKILDRNGKLLAEIYSSQNRTIIPLSDVPPYLRQATLAIEDKNFYKHPGFDIPSIIRAFRETVTRKNIQGGSTITQQLIKSSILTPEQSLSRKAKELVLAFWAEHIYTKDQILEMYFNQVPYGGTAWGIEAASETYFNKPVKKLTLAESAFLAGLTSAPSYFSPYGNYPKAWKGRQKEVLKRMVATGAISQKLADAAAKEPLHFREQQTALHAPHFVTYVRELLTAEYGQAAVEKGGLSITTSLDLSKQEMAEKYVADEIAKSSSLNFTNGAALVTDPKNGDILAMVGSHDFSDPNGGNVNIATSERQPGSSIKVVAYSAALSRGMTAATVFDDSPVSYPDGANTYAPVNYDGRYHGRVPFRLALANSYNIPAVKVLDQIGVPTMVSLGKNMGISSWGDASQYGLSLVLGAGEVKMTDMAEVYGTLADGGVRQDLDPILKITDSTGTVLQLKKQKPGIQVLDPGVAYIMSDILADNNARTPAFGPNSVLTIPGKTVSVKTGTTDNKRDNWTDGYTKDYVVVVWVGNNDNQPMSPTLASGITGAAPIWHNIMSDLVAKKPDEKPTAPAEIVKKWCSGHDEYFLKGTEDSASCGSPSPPTGAYTVR
jgi:1A family penicillin-binding protein